MYWVMVSRKKQLFFPAMSLHAYVYLLLFVYVLVKRCKRELIELNELENVVVAAMPKSTN